MPSDREPNPYLIPLAPDGTALLSVDASAVAVGWSAYFSEATDRAEASVLLHLALSVAASEGTAALEVREVRVRVGTGVAGFASSVLRDIPVLRIEAAINQEIHRRRIARHVRPIDDDGEDRPPGGGRYRTPPTTRPTVDPPPLRVEDPGGYRKPDEFYRHVAELFLRQASISNRPAHDLAEANNLPVVNVHRWIREAKARGLLLLPAHRGPHGEQATRNQQPIRRHGT